jgi:O-antigen/teichoic acid export membrane protein
MQSLLRTLQYLVTFGVARGGLFVAPLVLANLLPATDYGNLELAQAIASLGAIVLAFGTSAAVPLVVLRKAETGTWGGVLVHQILTGSALLLISLLLGLGGAPEVAWLACACAAVLMLQSLWSVMLKTKGRAESSLFLDAGFWLSLAGAVVISALLQIPPASRAAWALAGLIVYLAALAGWSVNSLLQASPRSTVGTYLATVRLGLPLMTVSLLALLATTSGRLGVGLLSTPELTAEYSVLFRATALPIVAHQIVIVARYRQIFLLPMDELGRRLPWILALVVASIVVFWALSQPLGAVLGSAFVSAFARHRPEGLLILAQCILWSSIALNDMVNTRSLTAGTVAKWSALYFAIVLPLALLYLSARPVELSVFVPVHSGVMAGYFATQAIVMSRCGIRLHHTWSLTLLAFVALSALAFVF